MHEFIETPIAGDALFNCHAGDFSLLLCTYVFRNTAYNAAPDLNHVIHVIVIRVTAFNSEHVRRRDPDEIRHVLAAVGRRTDEVAP